MPGHIKALLLLSCVALIASCATAAQNTAPSSIELPARAVWDKPSSKVTRDGRAIAFDSIRGVEVLSKGRAIRLTTAEGTHKFDIAVEGVESLLSDILLRLNAGRCAVNFRSVEQALEAIRDRSEPPTAKRVFASAMLGTLVMGATYIAFVMLLPYIL